MVLLMVEEKVLSQSIKNTESDDWEVSHQIWALYKTLSQHACAENLCLWINHYNYDIIIIIIHNDD